MGSGSLHFWLNSTEVEYVEMVFVKLDDHNSKESRWLSKGKLASWTSTSFHLLRSNPFSFYISQISRFSPLSHLFRTSWILTRVNVTVSGLESDSTGVLSGAIVWGLVEETRTKREEGRESSVSQPEAESAKTNETKVSRNSPCRLLERLVELRRAKRRGEGGIVEREFYFSNSVG